MDENNKYKLRTAEQRDWLFLFCVSKLAMLPVRKARNPDLEINLKEEFDEYYEKFDLEDMQIIESNGTDVGRLRIERSPDQIYVWGVQILPWFQGKDIGTAIFKDLIEESNNSNTPIKLKVDKANDRAISFYKKFGFIQDEDKEKHLIMKYNSK
ncbi:MAG: GNAT family N-acetyltransferase [Candidatus Magasanikbacteria bacterium]